MAIEFKKQGAAPARKTADVIPTTVTGGRLARGAVKGVLVGVRCQPDQLAAVDRWRSAGESRADVIRALITARMNRGG